MKMAVVGCEASGKTVFMCALADYFGRDAANNPMRLKLTPENAAANNFERFQYRQMRCLRQWPPATPPDRTIEIKWSLRHGAKRQACIDMLEFGGETFRSAFKDGVDEVSHETAVTELLNYLSETDFFVILVSIKALLDSPSLDSEEDFNRETEALWVTRGIIDFIRSKRPDAGLVIGLTQADKYRNELGDAGGPQRFFASRWPTVAAAAEGIPVIEVASVSKVDKAGNPAEGYHTHGILPVMRIFAKHCFGDENALENGAIVAETRTPAEPPQTDAATSAAEAPLPRSRKTMFFAALLGAATLVAATTAAFLLIPTKSVEPPFDFKQVSTVVIEKVVTNDFETIVEKPVTNEVEKIVEKVVETVVTNDVERIVEIPVTNNIETIVESIVEKIVTNDVETIFEVPVTNTIIEVVEKIVTNDVETIVEVPVTNTIEKLVEVPVTKTIEKIIEKVITNDFETIVEVPVTNTVETIVEKPVTVTVEKIIEIPVTNNVETIVEVPVTNTVETVVEKVVEKIVEKPVTNIVETIVEKVVEKPVTNIVETVVEKVVEKIVTNNVETIVERPVTNNIETVVEKVVEKIVTNNIETVVEKPVTITNTVAKLVKVPVTNTVEKIVEKVIEKVVTNIVEKPVAIPVATPADATPTAATADALVASQNVKQQIPPGYRVWTDYNGRKIIAKWMGVAVDESGITILTRYNRRIDAALWKFSSEDQAYIKGELKRHADNGEILQDGIWIKNPLFRK